MEPAVSVRPRWKNLEFQSEALCEEEISWNVCLVVEGEMDEEVLDDKEELSEGSRAVRGRQKRMMTPTLGERQEPERTHIPYRSWCRHCVAGRAGYSAHRGRRFAVAVEEDKEMKQVSYDYCFRRDQPGSESAKILVSKDRATRMVSAHVVPFQGAVIHWVIQQCARDLERLGHCGQITLKSDQETAIVDVLTEIANLHGSPRTLLERLPIADSQSNGFIERGNRSVEEMTRLILFDLSSRV